MTLKPLFYFLIIATVANIILDLLFVAVFKMGVAGAAYATLIANGLAFARHYLAQQDTQTDKDSYKGTTF